MLVAVYGTLKQGYENYQKYLSDHAPVLVATLREPYVMYATRDYPMLVPSTAIQSIVVEVYDVTADEMAKLDALEAPYGYERRTIRIPGLDGDVGLYVHPDPVPEGFVRIPSGEWDRAAL